MAREAWMRHPDADIEVLRVPSQSQPDSENKCMAYAVWDVLHYIAEWHPVDWVRKETPKLDITTIQDGLNIRRAGWIPDIPGGRLSLSDATGPVRFVHRYWESPPPTANFYELLQKKLEKDLPIIVMIDTRALTEGIPNDGPLHSVVVTGLSAASIVVNNPWGRQHEILNKQDFYDAWNARKINQLVRIDIVEQSTLQETLPLGDES